MSYILDALKRAESERDRGAIPGLHAQQLASYDDPDPQTSQTWIWLVAAFALVLVAGATGYWWWRTPTPEAAVVAPKPIAKPAVIDAPVVVAALPTVATSLPTAPAPATNARTNPPANTPAKPIPAGKSLSGPPPVVAVKVAPQPNPAKAPVLTAPAIAPATSTVAPPPPAPVANVRPPAQALPPLPATAVPSGKGTAGGTGLPMLSELPEAMRRQIPPLTIAGAVYSDDPAQRMLIINNQTFGQGNSVASGLQLEEIHVNSSIFNFQGTRFQLDH